MLACVAWTLPYPFQAHSAFLVTLEGQCREYCTEYIFCAPELRFRSVICHCSSEQSFDRLRFQTSLKGMFALPGITLLLERCVVAYPRLGHNWEVHELLNTQDGLEIVEVNWYTWPHYCILGNNHSEPYNFQCWIYCNQISCRIRKARFPALALGVWANTCISVENTEAHMLLSWSFPSNASFVGHVHCEKLRGGNLQRSQSRGGFYNLMRKQCSSPCMVGLFLSHGSCQNEPKIFLVQPNQWKFTVQDNFLVQTDFYRINAPKIFFMVHSYTWTKGQRPGRSWFAGSQKEAQEREQRRIEIHKTLTLLIF